MLQAPPAHPIALMNQPIIHQQSLMRDFMILGVFRVEIAAYLQTRKLRGTNRPASQLHPQNPQASPPRTRPRAYFSAAILVSGSYKCLIAPLIKRNKSTRASPAPPAACQRGSDPPQVYLRVPSACLAADSAGFPAHNCQPTNVLRELHQPWRPLASGSTTRASSATRRREQVCVRAQTLFLLVFQAFAVRSNACNAH